MGFDILSGDATIDGIPVTSNYDGRDGAKYINSERRQVRRSVQSDALPFNKKIWDKQELSVKIVVR
jgi:hypothetical protein